MLAGGAALVLVALALVAALLPRWVASPEFQAALSARASEALGTPVAWERLSIGLLPPRVVIESPALVGEKQDADGAASIRADAIDLRLSLLPLLERRLAVDSLVLRGVEVVATRTAEGLILPEVVQRMSDPGRAADGGDSSEREAEDAAGGAAAPGAPETGVGADAFTLDLRSLRIEDGRVLVHDRTFEPAVDWQVEALSARARGRSLGEPLDLRATAHVLVDARPLGNVALRGRVSLEGDYALDVELEAVPVAELQRFAGPLELSAGVLSASVAAVAEPGTVRPRLEGTVGIDALALRTRGVDVAGDLLVRARPETGEAIGFEATFRPAGGGKLEANGVRSAEGRLELTALLEAFDLAPFAALAGEGRTLSGRATGEVSLALADDALARLDTDLEIESARYADARIDAQGRLDLALGLEGLGDEAPVRLQAVFEPEQGGRLDVAGTGTLAGAAKGALRFDALDLALLAPLLPAETQVEGKLTGDLELDVTAERAIERIASRLRVASARLRRGGIELAGDLAVDARSEGGGPVELAAKADLAEGGRIAATGTASRAGELDLGLALTDFALASLMPLVDSPGLALAGRASGTGRVVGPYGALRSIALDLDVADARLATEDARLEGPFALALDVASPLSAERRGRLDLDLADAEVRSGERFVKPVGVRAKLSTKFEPGPGGALAFETKGALNDVNSLVVAGTLGPRTALVLTTSSFDAKGWGVLVPALAPWDPAGMVAFEGFSLTRSEGAPDRFGGRVALRGIDLTLPGAGRVRVRGTLDGVGERLDLELDSVTLHGLTVGLDGYLDDPLGEARFQVAAHSIGEAEANTFVSGLANVRDTLFGPLRLDARLGGIAGGEARLVDTLAGNLRFTIGESGGGRLRGVSLLQATLGQIPILGGATRVVARLREQTGGPGYLGEPFEILEGDLAIAEGRIEARALRLRRAGYEARLTGQLALDDLALDMKGELLLDPPLVAALSGRPGAALAGRSPVRIPLARVTNTLADPKVSLTAETLAAAPTLLLMTTGVGGVVDRTVGQATERLGEVRERVGDAVGGALGRVGRTLGGPDGAADAPSTPPERVEAPRAPERPAETVPAVPAPPAPTSDTAPAPAPTTEDAPPQAPAAAPEATPGTAPPSTAPAEAASTEAAPAEMAPAEGAPTETASTEAAPAQEAGAVTGDTAAP